MIPGSRILSSFNVSISLNVYAPLSHECLVHLQLFVADKIRSMLYLRFRPGAPSLFEI